MKKLTAMLLCLAMLFAFAGCGSKDTSSDKKSDGKKVLSIEEVEKTVPATIKKVEKDKFKIGLICLHDENSTYDNNFIQALKEAQKDLGLKD